jgi:hypothetical protein
VAASPSPASSCSGSSGFNFPWTDPRLRPDAADRSALSLGAHYRIEYSARWKLRRAFKSYMSDEQARQIDEDDVSLEPGGKEIEVTVLFSDLAGFTSMSEGPAAAGAGEGVDRLLRVGDRGHPQQQRNHHQIHRRRRARHLGRAAEDRPQGRPGDRRGDPDAGGGT